MKKKIFLTCLLVSFLLIFSLTTLAKDVPTLKWITVGNGMPANYDKWQAEINQYLEKEIGVHLEIEVVSWGDWENRRNIVINSGEYFDLIFTDASRYTNEVKIGAFKDITKLVKENASELDAYIPDSYWKAVKVNNKIYSVPTYKDSSLTNYLVWDKNIVDKYNVAYQEDTSLASLTDDLKRIKKGENKSPLLLAQEGLTAITNQYDNLGTGLRFLGVQVRDQDRKVVNLLDQKEFVSKLEILHQWYKAGIINSDAPIITEVPQYRILQIAQGWSTAAKTVWGPNMGTEAVAVQYSAPIVSNRTVRGSLNAIYSGSRYPKKALELLELANLDPYFRDSLYYGLEGDNFVYNQAGKIERLNNNWGMAGYTQATFFTVSQLAEQEVNQWQEVQELNEKAFPSVMLGFDMDTSDYQNELANCISIYNKYKSILLTGSKAPKPLIAKIKAELEAAGFNKLQAEAQRQVDEFYNN
ncbi:ABC transporter substrate-binding protein [Halanaerobium praevalens]|uniref:Carbohydrate ABC transporter substrate-binding protein, CUT1 family n=1 Tax=Halanaerobium praevalens (strain ATCC 33744 / DSM 2228 / GSL) TaxID=572479 RepID=E3DS37_HALPG|nr:ABC transporter substrate-binding protein [Halanaerobium praevalens]ADO78185.1 carbohydrate ABC transporter substrate-binding protein, CUT1 family [Halanaerobium praevalens DSM 2228]